MGKPSIMINTSDFKLIRYGENFMRILFTILVALLTIANAGEGKLGGLVFHDFTYDLTKDADVTNEFGIKRVYFTYQQEISDGIKYKFQTDINYKTTPKNLYLKNAKVDWSSPMGKITFGLQGMNVFSIQEKTWGYRFIEKSAMDQRKFSSSADLGVGYSNTFASRIHFSALYTNGTGYKKSESDSYKKLSFQALLGEKKLAKKDGFNIGGIVAFEPYDYEVDSVTVDKKTKMVFGLFGGYAGSGLRVGGEFDRFTDSGVEKTKQIISVYANYKISKSLQGYCRFDIYDPDNETEKDSENYLIAGFGYTPGKGLTIAPNIRYTKPQEGDATTLVIVNFQFKF